MTAITASKSYQKRGKVKPICRSRIKKGPSRYAAKDSHWRHDVFGRDIYRCQISLDYADDAYYIYGKQAHPELRYCIDNGISLTRSWHRWARDNPAAFMAWFKVARPTQWLQLENAKDQKR